MNTSLTRKKFLFGGGAAVVGALVPGPHKIPLIAHAEKGGPAALAVRDFLRPLVS
jgi:hypothetical protein